MSDAKLKGFKIR